MTYVVSARRWRPQVFADLVGQDHISRTLSNAIRADRVAHAFLFTGLRGVGKTTAARILAKALNCEKGPTAEPCNECSNCTEITEGRSVDVLEIDGASNTGVDDVREIIDNVRYQPAKSGHKIYIIDEVHMLSNNAFNALLKTLEEPPAHVKFVFATTDPQKLPATVQSRCQRYDFRRIPLSLVVERLREIADDQKVSVSDKVLFTVAREGEGSMRDAQSLLDQIVAGADGAVSDEDALTALGVADRSAVFDIAGGVIGKDARRVVEVLDSLHRLGCDMRRLSRDLLEHFRDLAVVHVSDGKLVPELPDEDLQVLREQARGIAPRDADRCFRLLLQTDEEVSRASSPKLVLEMAVLRLAAQEPLVPVDELVRRIESLAAGKGGASGAGTIGGGGGPVPGQRPGARRSAPGNNTPRTRRSETSALSSDSATTLPSPQVDSSSGFPEELPGDAPEDSVLPGVRDSGSWEGYCAFAGQRVPTLASHLATCDGGELEGNVLTIHAVEGFRANYLSDSERCAQLQELASEFFGRRVRVHIKTRSRDRLEPGEAKPSQADRAEAAMNHPIVRAAMDILGGEVAEVRERRSRQRGDGA